MASRPIILLHGALGSKDQFAALKKLLSTEFQVFDLNFSGHGGDTTISSFSMETFSDDVIGFMNTYGIHRCDFFGYSMGGYVALTIAKRFPERVGRIVTLATKFSWDKESAAMESKMLIPEKVEEKIPHFAATLRQRHGADWKEVMRKTATMMLELGNGAALMPSDFQAIETPVLITVGDSDKMVSVDESRAVAELLPNGKFQLLANTPHPFEQVDTNLLKDLIYNKFQPDTFS